tara:strand:+ start:152 stop:865 length:714 start_codon:yes stop_codon:yes gene_type:complete
MATTEEKQELVEELKGPRYYRVLISGYGGESAYMQISKEAHDFWQPICEENGDSDLVAYMLSDDDEEPEYEDVTSVPTPAQFLNNPDDDNYKHPWYESYTEFEHSWGVEYGSAHITIEQVESADYNATHVKDILAEDVDELNDRIIEDNETEIVQMDVCSATTADYIAQLYSSEKGTFFDGIIETTGSFDVQKLQIRTMEYLNGEDTITEVMYNGESVDNLGGDTNGKGYYASVWKA